MLALHPQILEKDGRKEFAILPYDEFQRMSEELADYQDLKDLRAAKSKEADAGTLSLAEAREELNL
ncbi:MAG: type II toxin-antitoxin system Phd/YefM family antitoxin [Lentisphaeria bacterium]|nr:type II toxin-antitoxin system Phd/YefM family antitoxin [Lentisphaeria bacterium]